MFSFLHVIHKYLLLSGCVLIRVFHMRENGAQIYFFRYPQIPQIFRCHQLFVLQ